MMNIKSVKKKSAMFPGSQHPAVSGSITVFFSIVMILIIALLCTLVESACVGAGRIYSEEMTTFVAQGTFSLYERELWEDYGLFGFYDQGEGKQLQEDYMELLQKNLQNQPGMLNINCLDFTLEKTLYLSDDEGKWYKREVVDLMEERQIQEISLKLQEALEEFQGINSCMEIVQAQMKAEESLRGLAESISTLRELVQSLSIKPVKEMGKLFLELQNMTLEDYCEQKSRKALIKKFQNIQKECKEQAENIQKIQNHLAQMKEQISTVKEAVENFSRVFMACKDFLDKDTRKEFSAKLNQLENYADVGHKNEVEKILESNQVVFQSFSEISTDAFSEMDKESLEDIFSRCKEQLDEYTLEEIQNVLQENSEFSSDESQKKDGEQGKNLLATLQDLSQKGILELVMPDGNISSLSMGDDKEQETDSVMGDFFQEASSLEFDTDCLSQFSSLGEKLCGISEAATDALEQICLCQYGVTYFSFCGSENFSDNECSEKTGVLNYETEYMIGGEKSDRANLTKVVNQLLFVRTALNYVCVRKNTEMMGQAKSMATAVTALMGIEPLAGLVENALLLAISYEESIVDVAGLLAGKRVPFLKKQDSFQLSFDEALSFGRKIILEKRDNFEDVNAAIHNGFSYKEYLLVLLFLKGGKKLVQRQQCLIQHNLKHRYGVDFFFSQCLYGAKGVLQYGLFKNSSHYYNVCWAFHY